MRRRITSGSVFRRVYRVKRTGELRRTRIWHLRYYVKGKPVTISSGTSDYDQALAMLRERMASLPRQDISTATIRMGDLFDLVLEDYRFQQRHTTYDVEKRIEKWLRPFFGEMKARDVVDRFSSLRRRYIEHRLRQKPVPENGTINRELACVRRALRLGYQHEPQMVFRVPHVELLSEDNVREGTLTDEQYRILRHHLPSYARIALVLAYHTGVRKGALSKIRRDKVDLKAGRIELPMAHGRGKPRPKYIPIFGDMAAELEMTIAAGDPNCPFLIQHEGRAVRDWEKSWKTACTLAKLPQALFHDLRRTALTNMIEAGLSEKEAMEISGHRTRAVFDRYHIVSDRRLKVMAEKIEQHLKTKRDVQVHTSKGETVN